VFALFACYSLDLAIAGAGSCGCFGRLHVHPWITVAIDMSAVCALILSMPGSGQPPVVAYQKADWRFLTAGTIAAFALAVAPLALLQQLRFGDDGMLIGESFIALDPVRWIGKQFPIADQIDIGDQFLEGQWTVVLYHFDCSKCQEAISGYSSQPRGRGAVAHRRVALVQVPPIGRVDTPFDSSTIADGRLDERREWFVETPIEITMRDGQVIAVAFDDFAPARADAMDAAGLAL
jgi:hypothetical protein